MVSLPLPRGNAAVQAAPETTHRPFPAKSRPPLPGERSIEAQLASLAPREREAVATLRRRWEGQPEIPHAFDDAMLLRFARCSPGPEKFNVEAAWKVMRKYDGRYLTLTSADLEEQLRTRTLFVPPGLTSRDGHPCFYMRPSRYFPGATPTATVVDNLAYCMGTLTEREKACAEGIGFVANMDGWTLANFSTSYCLGFMKMLQGRIPARVRLFLIVNPPSWFGKIWAVMKPMLAKDFRKKVHMIPAAELGRFLADGYERYLPDELEGGEADAGKIVEDFIAFRRSVEGCVEGGQSQ